MTRPILHLNMDVRPDGASCVGHFTCLRPVSTVRLKDANVRRRRLRGG